MANLNELEAQLADFESQYIAAAKEHEEARSAWALVGKGCTLQELNRYDDAAAVFSEVEARFGDATDTDTRAQAARATNYRAHCLVRQGHLSEARAALESLLTRVGEAEAPELLTERILAMYQLAKVFRADRQFDEALFVLEDLVNPFEHVAPPAAALPYVAEGLLLAGAIAEELDQPSAAIAFCKKVVDRYEDETDPEVQEIVSNARAGISALSPHTE